MVVEAHQSLQALRQILGFSKKNCPLPKSLFGILHFFD